MFWSDIRASQSVSLNCSLVQQMIQDRRNSDNNNDDDWNNDPAENFVRDMTLRMEDFIECRLNHYETVSLWEAFEHAWDRQGGAA